MADHNKSIRIIVKQGEDFSARVEWIDDDGEGLTLKTEAVPDPDALLEVRRNDSDELIFFFNTTDPDAQPNAYQGYIYIFPKGEVHLYIPWRVTDRMPVGIYRFDMFMDVQLTEPSAFKPSGDSQRRSLFGGVFEVVGRVTRWVEP